MVIPKTFEAPLHHSYIKQDTSLPSVIILALVGYEWLIVLGILLVVFLWGPQKLPELAKSIGLAKKEFEKAAKEVSSPTSSTSTPQPATDPLIVAAKNLGLTTEGKTKEEIAREIADKTSPK
jgi:sec-independent protein translocase protein TatA